MCFVSDPLLAEYMDGQQMTVTVMLNHTFHVHGLAIRSLSLQTLQYPRWVDDKVGEISHFACYCVSLTMLLLLRMHQINQTIHYNVQ